MQSVQVHYTVELSDKAFNHLLTEGQEAGHGYNDAGPIETVRRLLVASGLDTIPESKFCPGKDFTVDEHKHHSI